LMYSSFEKIKIKIKIYQCKGRIYGSMSLLKKKEIKTSPFQRKVLWFNLLSKTKEKYISILA
jgi:hypothetical protein